MIPTANYLRFSGRRQIGGISLIDQIRRLRDENRAAGEVVVGEYIDQAKSGANAVKRPEYQRLLDDARAGKFRRVRVESVDRGHRNDFDRRAFEMEMQRLGIEVRYCGEPDIEAPEYRIMRRGLLGVAAEAYSNSVSQTIYKRAKRLAELGRWRGGPWPYGLRPDGSGWLEADPESYHYLIWILERRAEGIGHHSITKLLNNGISIDGEAPHVPPTAGMLEYQRKPYTEIQDPETGEVIRIPKEPPSGLWLESSVRRLCRSISNGVYAGVLTWGKRSNRFSEDSEGRPKHIVSIDTKRPLIPDELLRRVQAVEEAALRGQPQSMARSHKFLLRLHCGLCGEPLYGYTSTKQRGTKLYKYRKYRCFGRSNKHSCRLPIFGADAMEHLVIQAVLGHIVDRGAAALTTEIQRAGQHTREVLIKALDLTQQDLQAAQERRNQALDALMRLAISSMLHQAMTERAEALVAEVAQIETSIQALQRGIRTIDEQVRSVAALLDPSGIDISKWKEERVFETIKRALFLLIARAEVQEIAKDRYVVLLQVHTIGGLICRQNPAGEGAYILELTTLPLKVKQTVLRGT